MILCQTTNSVLIEHSNGSNFKFPSVQSLSFVGFGFIKAKPALTKRELSLKKCLKALRLNNLAKLNLELISTAKFVD